jgi:hypothetical protein
MMTVLPARELRLNKPVRADVLPLEDPSRKSCLFPGMNYEKKAKKNARDATEEHSRYLALLGALGPEMNQDK